MYLLDENYNPITKVGSSKKYFWIYDVVNKDFFLRSATLWYETVTEAYKISVGGHETYVPANTHIIIGDMGGELDNIKPEEVVGREFDILTFNRTLDEGTWKLLPLKIIGYKQDYQYVYPVINSPVPVLVGETLSMLVSTTDIYRNVKDLTFSDIV